MLLGPSLFACLPRCEEAEELYRKIRMAEVGSRVRATGIRGDQGIELTDLVVLKQ